MLLLQHEAGGFFTAFLVKRKIRRCEMYINAYSASAEITEAEQLILQENIARKGELELELEHVAAANELELNTLYTTFWEDSSR